MVLPIIYRKNPPFQINYNWTDTLSNIGYITFYGAVANSTSSYLTTNSSVYSNLPYVSGTLEDAAGTRIDKDFDYTFKTSATIAASNAIISISGGFHNTGGTRDPSYKVVVTIYHVRGVTETQLGTADGATHSGTADAYYYFQDNIAVTLTEQAFVSGDKLRITIQGYGETTANTATLFLFCDPADSMSTKTDSSIDSEAGTRNCCSSMICQIPFKIDT